MNVFVDKSKDTSKAFYDFKNKQKSVKSNVLLICKSKYVYSESVFNTIYIDIQQMLKDFPKTDLKTNFFDLENQRTSIKNTK